MRRTLPFVLIALLAFTPRLAAWGERGHQTVNRGSAPAPRSPRARN
jgi:hypothetical protein